MNNSSKRKLETFHRHPGQFWEHKYFCVGIPMCNEIECRDCMFSSKNKAEFHKWNRTTAVPEETPGGSTPSQYRFPKEYCEIQDLIEHRAMNFSIGNIFKACFRLNNCGHSDAVRDLNKILWFAQRELNRVQGVHEEMTK